jgi:transcriptional regulator with XRE-family HTH domain
LQIHPHFVPGGNSAVRDTGNFAAKLELALKALNMSRGRLASEARIDKSLVSRWLRGVSAPRGHNLEAVTALMAANVAGFNQLSWELPVEAFARLFEPKAGEAPSAGVAWVTPADLLMAERRAGAYEGFWRVTHPSLTRPGVLLHQYVRIRREADGLMHMNVVYARSGWNGPLIAVGDQLYGVTREPLDGTFAFFVFHAVIMPMAEVLDGLVLVPALAQLRPISACPYYMERIGELSGDREADDATLEALRADLREADVPDDLKRHLLRDTGPIPTLEHGVLRLASEISRSRGRPAPGA